MYKGTFDGSTVCVKRARMSVQDVQEKAKVHFDALVFPARAHASNSGLLQRGRNMEILGSPKHLTPSGDYDRSLTACFEMGIRRKFAGVHQKTP